VRCGITRSFAAARFYHKGRLAVAAKDDRLLGSGVIWDVIPFDATVIPAKAGIQSVDGTFPKTCGVDSRLRGNDCSLEHPCGANDATTDFSCVLNCFPSYFKIRQEVEAMLKARVSSRGQLALPKEVRDELGLGEGAYLTVRVEGDR
jgi:AbrB family looped-hinge helix DNA binding protein